MEETNVKRHGCCPRERHQRRWQHATAGHLLRMHAGRSAQADPVHVEQPMNLSKFRLSRRDLLQAAALSIAANSLAGCGSSEPEAPDVQVTFADNGVLPWSNWSGNQSCQPARREVPRSEQELCELLKSSTGKIR